MKTKLGYSLMISAMVLAAPAFILPSPVFGDDDRSIGSRDDDDDDRDDDDDNDDDFPGLSRVVVRGPLSSVSDTGFSVGNRTFVIISGTRFSGMEDEQLMLADFTVGQFVKAKGVVQAGVEALTALELELEDPKGDDDIGDDRSDDDDDRREKRRKRLDEQFIARCNLPSLNELEASLTKAISSTLAASGAIGRVTVKARYLARPAPVRRSELAAATGVAISIDDDGVSLVGSYDPEDCSADVALRVILLQDGERKVTRSMLSVEGQREAASAGRKSRRGGR